MTETPQTLTLPPTAPEEPPSGVGPIERWVLAAAIVAVVVAGVVLRFWTTSDLWLDEALSANIAKLPLREIPDALRQDGSPPLYYLLLHAWTAVFGTGDLAVRSLSGVISVATLPVIWFAGRRAGGTRAAWASLVVLAASPFAVRYATETRMYALIMLLTATGYVALSGALVRPSARRVAGVAAVTAALVYTHYWTLYLVAATGFALVVASLRGSRRTAARRSLAAVALGCLAFVPWLPIFLFQLQRTGTPWGAPIDFSAATTSIRAFAGGVTTTGAPLTGLFYLLLPLGMFAEEAGRGELYLSASVRPRARTLVVVAFTTLLLAIVVGGLTGSTYVPRYISVIFPLFVVLVGLGAGAAWDNPVGRVLVAGVVVLGLLVSQTNVMANRTQAGQVAATIRSEAAPGDLVVYCPDQQAPAVTRLLPDRYEELTFPLGPTPERVNWIDYQQRAAAADPFAFINEVNERADGGHGIWLVWFTTYRGFEGKCERVAQALEAVRGSAERKRIDEPYYVDGARLTHYPPLR
jgi:mannosyltransferase